MADTVLGRRLVNQRIDGPGLRTAAEVVAWSGAVQAQEYEPAKWGIGLRMRDGARVAEVERAVERGEILRTHVLRPTWHFVTPTDIRWMLELTAPRVHQRMAIYRKQMELDAPKMRRGTAIIERALGDGGFLTRAELAEELRRARLPLVTFRLGHLMLYAEVEGVVCSGPRRGKQSTYALLSARAPGAKRRDRDDALGELARRFLQSHGPATIRDFVWWSGLTTPDAKRAFDIVKAKPEERDGLKYWTVTSARLGVPRRQLAHLLPIYDEYLVAYRDRDAIPYGALKITAAYGRPVNFQHAVVVDGKVAGTWRIGKSSSAPIEVTPIRALSTRERRCIDDAVARFSRFREAHVAR